MFGFVLYVNIGVSLADEVFDSCSEIFIKLVTELPRDTLFDVGELRISGKCF